ncbi:MAG TPA: glycosyl hydrolase family 18 protein [Gemmatimonadaceae bacterium]|nr:glycosyl hydrolase family 18 protein [Gemmatimonadaceae bacterium]
MHRFFAAAVVAVAAALAALPVSAQTEALWYSTDAETSVQSFLANAGKITVVAPQSFSMDSIGTIWGKVDSRVIATARAKGVKVIPLIVNPGFDQSIIHHILNTPHARRRAIRNIAALCRDNRFDGIQFDFENINVTDRDAFTSFSREVADSLHRIRCSLSAAVVPRSSEFPGATPYHQWIYDNWRGAYDYKALAESMDFLSLMTYSQHTRRTPPGPVAGYPWMEDVVKYVLSLGVPASKISLGLPSYSERWYPTYDAQAGAHTSGSGVSYQVAQGILAENGVTPTWDEKQKEAYAFWENDGINEFLFLEDARAFAARLALVSQYRLRGYSVWVLGQEDPAVWTLKGVRQ